MSFVLLASTAQSRLLGFSVVPTWCVPTLRVVLLPLTWRSSSQWLYLGFPLGAIAPLILYQLHKRYPDKKFNKIVVPLICNGANTIPQ